MLERSNLLVVRFERGSDFPPLGLGISLSVCFVGILQLDVCMYIVVNQVLMGRVKVKGPHLTKTLLAFIIESFKSLTATGQGLNLPLPAALYLLMHSLCHSNSTPFIYYVQFRPFMGLGVGKWPYTDTGTWPRGGKLPSLRYQSRPTRQVGGR